MYTNQSVRHSHNIIPHMKAFSKSESGKFEFLLFPPLLPQIVCMQLLRFFQKLNLGVGKKAQEGGCTAKWKPFVYILHKYFFVLELVAS